MKRSQVVLRDARADDAEALARLWGDILRHGDDESRAADVRAVVERIDGHDDERLVVAEYDGQVAGAVHLRATTLTPLNLEPVVQAISPHVFSDFRRHGVGRELMHAAVAFADERGIEHVATAAVAGARDANRFMARLALAPAAILRVAPTAVVAARLSAQGPHGGHPTRAGGRQLTHVLAARRSARRRRADPAPEASS
ncbi:GNAT family N-acetyltransferase [Nocardioides taihuensis]|uniref:GNAT family N-acetyltransferase n=1 Tax=Nocardioides taihuensis TaxID=1835606 RepID=A0ABW0BNX8_9ACTN